MAAKKGKMTAYLKKVVFSVSYQFRKSLKNTCLFYFKKDNLKRCSIYPEKNGWEEISKEEYNM